MNYKKHHIQKRKTNKERLDKWHGSKRSYRIYYGEELVCKLKLRKLVSEI
jgi:hypothetical protein